MDISMDKKTGIHKMWCGKFAFYIKNFYDEALCENMTKIKRKKKILIGEVRWIEVIHSLKQLSLLMI